LSGNLHIFVVDATSDRELAIWYSIAGFVKTSKPTNKNRIKLTLQKQKQKHKYNYTKHAFHNNSMLLA